MSRVCQWPGWQAAASPGSKGRRGHAPWTRCPSWPLNCKLTYLFTMIWPFFGFTPLRLRNVVVEHQRGSCTFFTRSWSGRPAWSPRPRLGSHRSPPSHRTALFHSGCSPSPRHPAPSRQTAGRSKLQRKTQRSHSQLNSRRAEGQKQTVNPPPNRLYLRFPSLCCCALLQYLDFVHFSWCLICRIGTLVCPDLFHVNGKRGLTSIWSLIPQVAMGGSNYQLVALSTACCLILSPLCCRQQATIMNA